MLNSALLEQNLITALNSQDGSSYDFWTNRYLTFYMAYASQATATGQSGIPGNFMGYRGLILPVVSNTNLGSISDSTTNYDTFISCLFTGIQIYWQPVLFSSGGYVTFDGLFIGKLNGAISAMKQYGKGIHSKEEYIREIIKHVHDVTRAVKVIFTLPATNPLPPNYLV